VKWTLSGFVKWAMKAVRTENRDTEVVVMKSAKSALPARADDQRKAAALAATSSSEGCSSTSAELLFKCPDAHWLS